MLNSYNFCDSTNDFQGDVALILPAIQYEIGRTMDFFLKFDFSCMSGPLLKFPKWH